LRVQRGRPEKILRVSDQFYSLHAANHAFSGQPYIAWSLEHASIRVVTKARKKSGGLIGAANRLNIARAYVEIE
jgi:hypothetical protein